MPFVMKRLVLLLVAAVLVSAALHAQLNRGGLAISTAVGGGTNVGGAYALSENLRTNLGIGFLSINPDTGRNRSSFAVQAGLWRYQPAVEDVTTFYGGTVEFSVMSGVRVVGDFAISANAGAEYWFSRRFAAGGYVDLRFQSGDRSAGGVKGSSLGTAGIVVFLTWWFQ